MQPRLLSAFVAAVVLFSIAVLTLGPPRAWETVDSADRQGAPGDASGGPQPIALPDVADDEGRESRLATAVDTASAAGADLANEPAEIGGLVVTGVVRESDDGAPVANVRLVLDHGGGLLVVCADGDGRFETEPVVEPGLLQVRHGPTDSDGAFPVRLRVAPSTTVLNGIAGDTVTLDVTLELPETYVLVDVSRLDEPASIAIRVTSWNGSPAPDRYLNVEDLLPDLGWWTGARPVTDEDGEAEPVAGARILDGGRLLGVTDGHGHFAVDLGAWPADGLTIDVAGHARTTWMPTDGFADLVPAVVEL